MDLVCVLHVVFLLGDFHSFAYSVQISFGNPFETNGSRPLEVRDSARCTSDRLFLEALGIVVAISLRWIESVRIEHFLLSLCPRL